MIRIGVLASTVLIAVALLGYMVYKAVETDVIVDLPSPEIEIEFSEDTDATDDVLEIILPPNAFLNTSLFRSSAAVIVAVGDNEIVLTDESGAVILTTPRKLNCHIHIGNRRFESVGIMNAPNLSHVFLEGF